MESYHEGDRNPSPQFPRPSFHQVEATLRIMPVETAVDLLGIIRTPLVVEENDQLGSIPSRRNRDVLTREEWGIPELDNVSSSC